MSALTFTELLVELYRRLNDRDPEPEVVEVIQQLREDNSLSEENQVPEWLTGAFEAALAGREVSKVTFAKIGSDIGSFLIEVSELIPGWKHDDQGEWATIDLPAIGMQILLSREAVSPEGRGCSSYSVRPLPPA